VPRPRSSCRGSPLRDPGEARKGAHTPLSWPAGARALAGRLRQAATFPRKIVIEIGCGKEGRAGTRTIRATAASADPAPERDGVEPSAPTALSAPLPKSMPANDFATPGLRTVANDADGRGVCQSATVRANALNGNGADDAGANPPPQSVSVTAPWRERCEGRRGSHDGAVCRPRGA
jgi:hypothetical protein